MRTIKFRGIGKRTGTWIYGNLIQLGGAYIISPIFNKYEIVPDHSTECALGFHEDEFDVIEPDSLGQFTGLLDKNGNEIYEGDIINMHTKRYGDEIFRIAYEDSHLGVFALCTDDVYSRFVCVFGKSYEYEPFYCEVIGNIHDNPELLKNND